MWRALPEIIKFAMAKRGAMQAMGCRRLEVRAYQNHTRARLLIARMGGRYVCKLDQHGRNGETFELWEWIYSDVFFNTDASSSHITTDTTKR